MKATIPFTTIAILASATAGTFFFKNQSLHSAVVESNHACTQQLTELEQSYQQKIDAMLARLPEGFEIPRTTIASAEEQKPQLEKLVSYGHKVRAITHKYEFILETAQIDKADKERLRRLLMQRETLAGQIAAADPASSGLVELEDKLTDIENTISNLLKDPIDYSRYQYLKERSL